MIFVIINIAITVYLFRLALNANIKNVSGNAASSLVNVTLLSAFVCGFMALVNAMILWGPENLTIVLEHIVILGITTIFIYMSFYFISCAFGKNKFLAVMEVIFVLAAAYLSITKVTVTDYKTISVYSPLLIKAAAAFPFNRLSWLQLYVALFILLLPMFSLLLLMVYAENVNSRLFFQRSLFFAGATVFAWCGSVLIVIISSKIRMGLTLFSFVIVVTVSMFVRAATQDKILDRFSMWSNFFFKILKYGIPAVFGSLIFVKLRPLFAKNPNLYLVIVFSSILVLALVAYTLSRIAAKISAFRSTSYGADFEADLASVDYNDETVDICESFYSIFQTRANVEQMKILIAGGNDELNTVFASDGNNVSVSTKDSGLELIRAEGINVFMEEDIQTRYTLQQRHEEVEKLLETLNAQSLIILNEGRHLIGVIALGAKRGGSSYDEYDKMVFDRLYSYFFVFGYYMSNIANASVVGTVNREIKMSAQIIKSIQENMDFLNNPKIDVGYLMVPAHNIGGEFVDLIRLSETRHIFVVGSMSGKGISASMSMVILKSIIRTLLTTTHDFKKLVAKVNSFIRTGLPKGMFFAGVFCMVDFETDTLYYINCGIPTMLLYTRSFNNVIEIQGSGFVLGFAKDITPLLKVKQMKLNPGDVLAVTTSGIINSHSLRGDQYGKDRIRQSMTDNYMYDGMHMAQFLFDDLEKFMAKELDEDITVMMLRYLDKDTQTVSNIDDEETVKEEPELKKPEGPIVLEAL